MLLCTYPKQLKHVHWTCCDDFFRYPSYPGCLLEAVRICLVTIRSCMGSHQYCLRYISTNSGCCRCRYYWLFIYLICICRTVIPQVNSDQKPCNEKELFGRVIFFYLTLSFYFTFRGRSFIPSTSAVRASKRLWAGSLGSWKHYRWVIYTIFATRFSIFGALIKLSI